MPKLRTLLREAAIVIGVLAGGVLLMTYCFAVVYFAIWRYLPHSCGG